MRESGALKTVLPMNLASGHLEPFVNWKCRILSRDDDYTCSDEERAVFDECFAMYPGLITQPSSRACMDRIAEEKLDEARGQDQQVIMPINQCRKYL